MDEERKTGKKRREKNPKPKNKKNPTNQQKTLKACLSRSKEITYAYMSDQGQSGSGQPRKILGLRKTE